MRVCVCVCVCFDGGFRVGVTWVSVQLIKQGKNISDKYEGTGCFGHVDLWVSSLIHSLGPCNFQHEILLSIKIILSISFVSIRAQLHSIPFDFIDLQKMLRILAIVYFTLALAATSAGTTFT